MTKLPKEQGKCLTCKSDAGECICAETGGNAEWQSSLEILPGGYCLICNAHYDKGDQLEHMKAFHADQLKGMCLGLIESPASDEGKKECPGRKAHNHNDCGKPLPSPMSQRIEEMVKEFKKRYKVLCLSGIGDGSTYGVCNEATEGCLRDWLSQIAEEVRREGRTGLMQNDPWYKAGYDKGYSDRGAMESKIKEGVAAQARAEERMKIGNLSVSWDIADGGKEWEIQIWHKDNKSGVNTLLQSINKNSDDGGNFSLTTLINQIKETK